MAGTEPRHSSARPPRWSLSEKRRIVELTHGKGASISEIAQAHGLHPTSLSHWRSLYRAGKLSDRSPRARSSDAASGTALLPVVIATRRQENATDAKPMLDSLASSERLRNAVVHVSLSSGATLRIETDSLDETFVRALLEELR